MVMHTSNPSYLGGGDRKIMVGGCGKSEKPYLKNKLKQKGLETWLKSYSTGSEFKPQCCQKKKKEKEKKTTQFEEFEFSSRNKTNIGIKNHCFTQRLNLEFL
jgi:hypothetical protein